MPQIGTTQQGAFVPLGAGAVSRQLCAGVCSNLRLDKNLLVLSLFELIVTICHKRGGCSVIYGSFLSGLSWIMRRQAQRKTSPDLGLPTME